MKERAVLRHALAAGAFALLLAGSFANANAATTKSSAKFSPTTTNDAVTSPDVAQWTSHLIVVTKSEHGSNAQFRSFAGGVLARTSKLATQLTRSALRFLGVPYVFGGTSTTGFDCSGYVQHVFAMLGVRVPRTADAQYDAGRRIVGGMRPGDLVFFQTYAAGASHVGIYLGHDRFVHASSSHGVMVSSLHDSYWAARYIGAKRILSQKAGHAIN